MPLPVTLHIYDVSSSPKTSALNEYLTALGTGAFHGAVEVDGLEWSYGYTKSDTGVFSCPPKGCTDHQYRESVPLGETKLSSKEVQKLIETMKKEWPGNEYDLLRRNCCVFSDAFAKRLGAQPVPPWVTNLAAAGATMSDGVISFANKAQAAVIIANAKAGEFDQKYTSGKASAKAKDVLNGIAGLDHQYKITATITGAGGQVVSLIEQGPEGLKILAFGGGVGSCVSAAFGIGHMLQQVGTNTSNFSFSHIVLMLYMAVFALTTILFEGKPEWIEKLGQVSKYQDFLMDNCSFLTTLLGRGLFYGFQGSIWMTFWAPNFVGFIQCLLGIYFFVILGGFNVAMHFGIQPKTITTTVVEKLRSRGRDETQAAAKPDAPLMSGP